MDEPAIDAPPTAPAAPPSPARLLVWSVAWAVVAALGFAVLVPNWQRVIAWDFSGQRTGGIVLFTPFIAVVLVVVLVIRAIRSARPAREYRSTWSGEKRAQATREHLAGQPSTMFVAIGGGLAVLWFAGVIAVAIFITPLLEQPGGLVLILELLVLLAMAWIPILRAGVRGRATHRRSTLDSMRFDGLLLRRRDGA